MTVEVKTTLDYRNGVTVTDNRDLSITFSVDNSQINLNSLGTYPVIYSATDSSGNETQVTIMVHVVDTTNPVIVGAKDISMMIRTSYDYLAGVTVTDNYEPNLIITLDSSQVNTKRLGTYPLTYSSVDSSGNQTLVTVTR
ncbi:MAG: hypothetical protein K0Q49_1977 [Haloplasmataceae bacterium]|nr:hypothetical protein [Haloplasmataceae bacterium]